MFNVYLKNELALDIPLYNGRFIINIDGIIIDKKYNSIVNVINKDTCPKVILNDKEYKLSFLIALSFKPINIEERDLVNVLPRLKVLMLDGDESNIHPSNLVWKFPVGLEHSKYPGYAYIPCYTAYVINKEGEVIRHSTGQVIKIRKRVYNHISLKHDVLKKTRTIGLHRALCLAWKDYDKDIDSMDTNHIDGIPGNDTLDNLELCTRRHNILHAVKMGLRTDNIPLLVRNVITEKVTEYFSIAECARVTGIAQDAIRTRLIKPHSNIYSGYLQFKRVDNKEDWVDHDNITAELRKTNIVEPVVCRNMITGEIRKTENAGVLASIIGGSSVAITSSLNKDKRSYIKHYEIRKETDGYPWVIADKYLKQAMQRSIDEDMPFRRVCYRIDGDNRVWLSSTELGNYLGVTKETILYSVNTNTAIVNFKYNIIKHSLQLSY